MICNINQLYMCEVPLLKHSVAYLNLVDDQLENTLLTRPFLENGVGLVQGYVLLVCPAGRPRSLYLPSGLEAESAGVRGQSLAGCLA